MSTPTTNYGWPNPTNNGDANTWGTELNTALSEIDAQVFEVAGSVPTYTALNKAGDTATALNITPANPPANNAAGYLGVPINSQSGAYTYVITDAGMAVVNASGLSRVHTIPLNASVAFPLGTIITAISYGGGITIAPTAGVTLSWVPTGANGNRTLSNVSMASLIKIGTDVWLINGSGIT